MSLSDSAYIRRFFSVYSQEEKDKVRGHAFYPSDFLAALLPEDVAHVYVLRSPHSGASFSEIDCQKAEALEGVLKVITAKDIPNNLPIGGGKKDSQLILPEAKVRFKGQPVALVVAESLAKAKEAASLIEIDWQPDEEKAAEKVNTVEFKKGRSAAGNWKSVETEFKFPSLHARYLEPESGWVVKDKNSLNYHIGSLLSESQRLWLSKILGIPVSQVTAQEAYLGGTFGGRQQREMIAFLGIASWACNRSCCLFLEYQNQDVGSYGYAGKLKIDYDPDTGELKKISGEVSVDSGSFEGGAAGVLQTTLEHAPCIYSFDEIDLQGHIIQTPTYPRRALKGEGITALTWVTEQLLDQIAEDLDIPSIEYRLSRCRMDAENALKVIEETEKLERPFRLLAPTDRSKPVWDAKAIEGHGVGFQIYQANKKSDINLIEVGLELQVSGSFVIRTSNHTLDLHMKSALADVAASVLRTHPKAFTVVGEMRLEFDEPRRRATYPEFYYLAQATWNAADQLKKKIQEAGGELMRSKQVELRDGAVVDQASNKKMGYRELAFTYGAQDLKAVYELKNLDRPHACSAGAVSRVSFHPLTGELSVDSVKVVVDAGPVVRRNGLELEAEAAVAWALAALFSSSVERDQPIPTALDGPDAVDLIPLEYPIQTFADEPPDYFGSKGVTDVLMAVVLSSLVTAIQDAKDQCLKEIPMLPDFMYPEKRLNKANMIPFRRN